jgi:cob(I)alamin adenosyltransferase
MNSVTTKTGDAGTSGVMFGARLPKTDVRFAALGAVDELNAALGLAKVAAVGGELRDGIELVQNELNRLSMELATLPKDFDRIGDRALPEKADERLHAEILALEAQGAVFKGFELPGKNPLDASLQAARTICRRAEREAWALHASNPLPRLTPCVYLNRLSDLLWVWALYYSA